MADKKISQLNITTTADDGSWLVMNDSGNTATYRITREDLLSGTTTPAGLVNGTGTDSMRSNLTTTQPTASGQLSIAIGDDSTATQLFSQVIGAQSNATGQSAIVLGSGSEATAQRALALGFLSKARQVDSIVVGAESDSNGTGAITIGKFRATTGTGAINVGYGNRSVSGNYSVNLGGNNTGISSTGVGNVNIGGLGVNITGTTNYTTFLNLETPPTSFASNTTYVDNLHVLGTNNVAGLVNGTGTDTIQSASFLTSQGTTASTSNSIAIGVGAEATSPYAIAIGYNARNNNRDGIRNNYICIGTDAQAVQESFALGTNARAFGADTCSVGKNALTLGNSALALGKDTQSQSTGGIALGYLATDAGNNYGIAIGASQNNTDYSTVIGFGSSTIDYTNQVVIGNYATGGHAQAVSLGFGVNSEYSATTHTNSLNVSRIFSVDTITASPVSGTVDFDLGQGSQFQTTLSGNSSINFINWREGQILSWWVYNDGSHTISALSISGGGSVYCQNAQLPNPTNNGYSYYTGTIYGGNLILLEHLNFQAV